MAASAQRVGNTRDGSRSPSAVEKNSVGGMTDRSGGVPDHHANDYHAGPQCGFASVAAGNEISWDDQRRKLELLVETARKVWGG
jgi:hypothetical protein